MSSTQERKKKRWQYLKDKGAAYTLMGILALMFVMVATFLYEQLTSKAPVFSILLGVICLLLMSVGLVLYFPKVYKESKELPYVPPVSTNTLPAEEVLVRGSEQPAQEQGKVLLRGTDGSAGTGQQELLRGSQERSK